MSRIILYSIPKNLLFILHHNVTAIYNPSVDRRKELIGSNIVTAIILILVVVIVLFVLIAKRRREGG